MDLSHQRQTFEKYKAMGNQIMLGFEKLSSTKEKIMHGQQAIDIYEIAFQHASGKDEKASSKKNCGFTAMKIGLALEEELDTFKLYWFIIAASFYKEAYYWGGSSDSGLPQEWKNGIIKNADTYLKQVLKILQNSDSDEKIEKLEIIENYAHQNFRNVQRVLQFTLSQCYYNVAVKMNQEAKFIPAVQHLKFAYQRFCKYQQYKELGAEQQALYNIGDLAQLEDDKLDVDISFLENRIWASQAMKSGNDSFKQALNEKEHLQMDLVQNALDHYSTALERGKKIKDDELRAEAQSMIGQIMYKVIKDSAKAFTYFFNMIEIADKFENAHLKTKTWFTKSQEYYDEINKSMVEEKQPCYVTPPPLPKPQIKQGGIPIAEEGKKGDVPMQEVQQPKWMMEPQNFAFDLAKLKEEYDKKDPVNFLQILEEEYMTDEWQKSGYKLGFEDLQPAKISKTVMKVIKFYHPDKQNDVDVVLKKFYAEVTKCLTNLIIDLKKVKK